MAADQYDLSNAVTYHYGKFPPANIDYASMIELLMEASEAIGRYDQTLQTLHNGEILLSTLRGKEAVISSRMEGTISTLDEILAYEAIIDDDGKENSHQFRSDTIEVSLFNRAMKYAQGSIKDGQPLSQFMLRTAHNMLLSFGRGADKNPGQYKRMQNYIGERFSKKISYVPVKPELLQGHMDALFEYIVSSEHEVISRSIITHVEFEALHPFEDGNGRIGRMLIPLMLWSERKISEPYFYISSYLEANKDEYIERMRNVSAYDDWDGWLRFMLEAYIEQARDNLLKARSIQELYQDMKTNFREVLQSQWSIEAADFMFANPVFKASSFAHKTSIPSQTAYRILSQCKDAKFLKTVRQASGRSSAVYSFEPLMETIRE